MFPTPRADLAPMSVAYETTPLVKPTGFREYDARWLLGPDLNLMGVQALGLGLGTYFAECGERQQGNHHRELKAVYDPNRLVGRGGKLARDRWQSDIGDGAVENGHGQGDPDRHSGPGALRSGQTVKVGHRSSIVAPIPACLSVDESTGNRQSRNRSITVSKSACVLISRIPSRSTRHGFISLAYQLTRLRNSRAADRSER